MFYIFFYQKCKFNHKWFSSYIFEWIAFFVINIGRWTVQEAAEQSIAAPTIDVALDQRYMSARKEELVKASAILKGPSKIPSTSRDQIIKDLEASLYASKIVSYAQGLGIIKAASDKYEWNVNLTECARLWKGGCIIRAKLLDDIQAAQARDKDLPNLIVDSEFAQALNDRQMAWRRIFTLCVASGLPCPALSGSLNYFDSYRRENLPANLTQAQRDFFGGHTYQRTDREGVFHCSWTIEYSFLLKLCLPLVNFYPRVSEEQYAFVAAVVLPFQSPIKHKISALNPSCKLRHPPNY